MTSPTIECALAEEAAAGRSRLADAYREGAEAMRERAIEIALSHPTPRAIYDRIRSIDLPEIKR